jgi:hypothetical protein
LSLGSFYSQATNDAIQEAIDLGIHFVIAGNYFFLEQKLFTF